jgi:hypothetical protein
MDFPDTGCYWRNSRCVPPDAKKARVHRAGERHALDIIRLRVMSSEFLWGARNDALRLARLAKLPAKLAIGGA